MIKFFRRIRQSLLAQNKFSKYLIYAIGEIVLVVIGILIALSINNWNQDRLNTATEKKILEEIKSDLNATLFDVVNDLEEHNEILESTVKSMEYLQQADVHIDTLTRTLVSSFSDTRTYAKSGGLDYLKSNGLAIIKSDSLRKAITDLYELSIARLYESAQEYDNKNEMAPYLKSHFTISSLPIRQIKLYYLSDSIPFYDYRIKDVYKLKTDTSLLTALNISYRFRLRKIRRTANAKRDIKDALDLINVELNKL